MDVSPLYSRPTPESSLFQIESLSRASSRGRKPKIENYFFFLAPGNTPIALIPILYKTELRQTRLSCIPTGCFKKPQLFVLMTVSLSNTIQTIGFNILISPLTPVFSCKTSE